MDDQSMRQIDQVLLELIERDPEAHRRLEGIPRCVKEAVASELFLKLYDLPFDTTVQEILETSYHECAGCHEFFNYQDLKDEPYGANDAFCADCFPKSAHQHPEA